MKPQPILLASAVLLMASGVATLFAPDEIAVILARSGEPASAMVVQLLGGALFALGFLDWMNRFATIGGIYGRPIVVANLAFFFIAATTFARRAFRAGAGAIGRSDLPLWVALAICAALAVAYARYMFTSPRGDSRSAPPSPTPGGAS